MVLASSYADFASYVEFRNVGLPYLGILMTRILLLLKLPHRRKKPRATLLCELSLNLRKLPGFALSLAPSWVVITHGLRFSRLGFSATSVKQAFLSYEWPCIRHWALELCLDNSLEGAKQLICPDVPFRRVYLVPCLSP